MSIEDLMIKDERSLLEVLAKDDISRIVYFQDIINDNASLSSGSTPLIEAINLKAKRCFEFILNQNIDPNIFDISGMSAILYACKVDDIFFLHKLLDDSRIDHNAVATKDSLLGGFNILHIASYYGNVEHCRMIILNKIVPIDAKTFNGLSIRDVATQGVKVPYPHQFLQEIDSIFDTAKLLEPTT